MTNIFGSIMLRILLFPITVFMKLFAVYVLTHGHYSPGGGFQAGVLLGASFILPLLLDQPGRRYPKFTEMQALMMGAAGVLIFLAFAVAPLLLGQPVLDYASLPMESMAPEYRRTYGILGIEVGVTLAVAGSIVAIYHALSPEREMSVQ